MEVAGHSPKELWRKFPYRLADESGWKSWNNHHLGEIIENKNGRPTNMGTCPTCGGKTKIPCVACKESGKLACWACNGMKVFSPTKKELSFIDTNGIPDPLLRLQIIEVKEKTLPFLFNSYSEGADGVKFFISCREGSGSYLVKLDEMVPDTKWPGYKTIRFDQKTEDRPDPSIKGYDGKPYMEKVDVSELQ